MKKLLFTLLTIVAIVGCSKDLDEDKSIVLTGGTETTQIVYADETSKEEGIKFTANESWVATVSEATRSASGVEWLRLLLDGVETYSGGKGSYTLSIALDANYTGSDRKAEIRIKCGNTIIIIIIEQKGTNSDGSINRNMH